MKKPPDPLPCLSQPPPQITSQPNLSFASHSDFLSYLLNDIFRNHHCFATCKMSPLFTTIWPPPRSCFIFSMQICLFIEDLLQFKRRFVVITSLTPPKVAISLAKGRMWQSILLHHLGPQLPTSYGLDRSLKLVIRRSKLHLDASVNGYIPYPLEEISTTTIGEAYSLAIAPGVIIPCSLIVMTKVMMFAFCVCVLSVISWVWLMRSLCLFISVFWSQLQYSPHLRISCLSFSMSNFSSQPPLSPLSESNGNGNDVRHCSH